VLPKIVRSRAETTPDQLAMVEVDGQRSVTWRECHQEALRWAAAYRALGVRPGDTVLTMLPNSVDAHIAWLALSWLRAIEVPVNNEYQGKILRYVVKNCRASVLTVADRYVRRFLDASLLGPDPDGKTLVIPDQRDRRDNIPCRVVSRELFLAGGSADEGGLSEPDAWDTAAIIYTSGTTGPSKGVLVPWEEMSSFSDGTAEANLTPGGRTYSPFSACHITGKNAFMTVAKYRETLVLRERFSVSSFWNDIRTHQCTSGMLVGGMAALLIAAPARPDDRDHPLRHATVGPIMPNIGEFMDRFNIMVASSYGMTEIGLPIASPDWFLPNTMACGKLKPGGPEYELRIADERDRPLGCNEVGELLVRSNVPWALNAGYFGMPEKTAQAWRNGWFHTGDAFKVDEDGWYYFVDRYKDALRRRGENISSFEVESYVNDHSEVAESSAVGVPSAQGEDEIKIYVVRSAGSALSGPQLIDYLAPRMPRFMLPRYVEFVDAIPKTDATLRHRKNELRKIGLNSGTYDREADGCGNRVAAGPVPRDLPQGYLPGRVTSRSPCPR
jgi:crotonobetaine/carnitine-CoA ligase